jgi:hypothetical protein
MLKRPAKNDELDARATQYDELDERSAGWGEACKAADQKKKKNGPGAVASDDEALSLDDFRAYMPMHSYIFIPSGEPWPATSINARIPPQPLLDTAGNPVLDTKGNPKLVSASTWLDQNRPVEQMTWAPGEPQIIADKLISGGGWIKRPGCRVFNLYCPPTLVPGDADQAGPWIEHCQRIYGEDAGHIIKWLAHRVQRPHEKINHALVLGGAQGVGKDTLLEPVKHAVGPWNFTEVSPQHLLGNFTGFLRSVVLRISEARDLGDTDRFKFYDHLKAYTAAPPDVLRCNEKHLREYAVPNLMGVIITTNYLTDGIYLPADDRRHFVAWCPLTKADFSEGYWRAIWAWYAAGGIPHVAAYLAELDLSDFDPKAPPPQTRAFWDIVNASRSPENAELADTLDRIGNPGVVTLAEIVADAPPVFQVCLNTLMKSREFPHGLDECG